ncbi:33554_t:CDS:2, partial [Racocetra persica]
QDNLNLTQKQVHAWWTIFIKKEYACDNNQLISTKIIVDATYKTNALGYELYSVIGQFDGSGFAMAYLFVEGINKMDGAQFFADICSSTNLARYQSSNLLFAPKKMIQKRLADNKYPKSISYSSYSAHDIFNFISIEFYPVQSEEDRKKFTFCPKDLRTIILNMIDRHMHLHQLISTKIIVDATYKTNALGYELYSVIGQFDGSGFAMAYLFVEGINKMDGAQFFADICSSTNLARYQSSNLLFAPKKMIQKRLADNKYPK